MVHILMYYKTSCVGHVTYISPHGIQCICWLNKDEVSENTRHGTLQHQQHVQGI